MRLYDWLILDNRSVMSVKNKIFSAQINTWI